MKNVVIFGTSHRCIAIFSKQFSKCEVAEL
jgi:hypothetical protein